METKHFLDAVGEFEVNLFQVEAPTLDAREIEEVIDDVEAVMTQPVEEDAGNPTDDEAAE